MNIIAVDDEVLALDGLIAAILETVPDAKVQGFYKGEQAISFAEQNPCDVVFLDIEMGGMDGISLAKRLKLLKPKLNIVFVTGHSQYAGEALSLRSSGYILKPVTTEKVAQEINNLRHPVSQDVEHQMFVRCFGNFEVFVKGDPIVFKHNKTKELFAYLIDREGAFCSNGEIISTLWENEIDRRKKSSYLRDLRADMLAVLRGYGVENAIRQRRGYMAVIPEMFSCDYYRWQRGEINAINAYGGEYMSQYSWGEVTLGGLERKAEIK